MVDDANAVTISVATAALIIAHHSDALIITIWTTLNVKYLEQSRCTVSRTITLQHTVLLAT